jgi:hypothetical protein
MHAVRRPRHVASGCLHHVATWRIPHLADVRAGDLGYAIRIAGTRTEEESRK